MTSSLVLAVVTACLSIQVHATESAGPSRQQGATGASTPEAPLEATGDPNVRPSSTTFEALGARSAPQTARPAASPAPREVDPDKLEKQKDRLLAKIEKGKCPKGTKDPDYDSSGIISKYQRVYADLMSDSDYASEIEDAIEERVQACIANGGKNPPSQEELKQQQEQMMAQMQIQQQLQQTLKSAASGLPGSQGNQSKLSLLSTSGMSSPYQASLTSGFTSSLPNSYMNSFYAPYWR